MLKRPAREASATDWYALSPLVLVALGIHGMFRAGARPAAARTPTRPGRSRLRPLAVSNHAPASQVDPTPQPLGTSTESLEFKPARAPWERVVILGLIAVLVNGIMATFLCLLAVDELPVGFLGVQRWPLLLAATVFGILGLGLIAATGYFFLALFTPRPWFRVNTRTLAPGDALEIEWRLLGRLDQIRRLRFFLEGIEVATYRVHGTPSDGIVRLATVREILDQVPIVELTNVEQFRAGRTQLLIPEGFIPSFESPHNRIEWSLRIHGEIPHRPDLQEGLPVTLLPVSSVATASSAPVLF